MTKEEKIDLTKYLIKVNVFFAIVIVMALCFSKDTESNKLFSFMFSWLFDFVTDKDHETLFSNVYSILTAIILINILDPVFKKQTSGYPWAPVIKSILFSLFIAINFLLLILAVFFAPKAKEYYVEGYGKLTVNIADDILKIVGLCTATLYTLRTILKDRKEKILKNIDIKKYTNKDDHRIKMKKRQQRFH